MNEPGLKLEFGVGLVWLGLGLGIEGRIVRGEQCLGGIVLHSLSGMQLT